MKIKKYIPQILLLVLFILTFAVNSQVPIMGDDYYYATFTRENFWELHKNHYLEANGRAIVHFIDSIFLALPPILWAFLNSVMLTGIAYFGSKIVELFTNKKEAFKKSIIIFIFGILNLNIYVIRQSVYWITGSFNYVYPIFMLFWYWYILLKNSKTNFNNKQIISTSILAFFASATVEQGGMMSFGATFLLFVYYFLDNKKNNANHNLKRLGIILLISFIGIISVVCSPAQFNRFNLEKENAKPFVESVKDYIKFLANTYIFKYSMQVLLAVLAVILIFIQRKKLEKVNYNQIYLIISSIILCIGSQLMMIVSPVYGERNTLFGIIMIIFFTAILLSHLTEYKNKYFNYIKNGFYILLLLISILNISNKFLNYKLTNEIDKENQKIISEYKKSNSNEPIKLYRFKDDKYGWSMPYTSPYHEFWFKVYYKIDTNSEIIWQEYKENENL